MYLNIRVPVPEVKGRIFFSNRKNGTIVNYEYGRVYVPEKRYNILKRTTIGKICPDDLNILVQWKRLSGNSGSNNPGAGKHP